MKHKYTNSNLNLNSCSKTQIQILNENLTSNLWFLAKQAKNNNKTKIMIISYKQFKYSGILNMYPNLNYNTKKQKI